MFSLFILVIRNAICTYTSYYKQHILPMMSGLSKAPRVAVKSSLVASSAWIQVARFKGLLEHWFYHLLTQVNRYTALVK